MARKLLQTIIFQGYNHGGNNFSEVIISLSFSPVIFRRNCLESSYRDENVKFSYKIFNNYSMEKMYYSAQNRKHLFTSINGIINVTISLLPPTVFFTWAPRSFQTRTRLQRDLGHACLENRSRNGEAINSTRNMIYSLKVFYFLLYRRRYFLFVSELI